MDSNHIKIHRWLLPLSWIYGLAVRLRNLLFDIGVLKSRSFVTPVISVGNITVGGTGKTPHVEYLVRLLKDDFKVAVLSRGYKRKSKRFVLADSDSTAAAIGDEPYQMHSKFPDIRVAVDKKRCHGIDTLCAEKPDTDVIVLDDAFQHRYVKPGINILLVDYNRMIHHDKLLPAGRLREPQSGKKRADIVIVTKCPATLRPMDYRVIQKTMDLYPFQALYFTSIRYGMLTPVYCGEERKLATIKHENVLLVTGIASPKQMKADLEAHGANITPLTFADHHCFTDSDVVLINTKFSEMQPPKIIVTTEKDATRIFGIKGLSDEVRHNMFVLPIKVEFMLDSKEKFNEYIISYVRKNSRNSILAKGKNDHKPGNSDNIGNRSRTISFRNN